MLCLALCILISHFIHPQSSWVCLQEVFIQLTNISSFCSQVHNNAPGLAGELMQRESGWGLCEDPLWLFPLQYTPKLKEHRERGRPTVLSISHF